MTTAPRSEIQTQAVSPSPAAHPFDRSLHPNLVHKGIKFYTPLVIGTDLLTRIFLPKQPHILIACMPKSGSTFLANALASYAGLRRKKLLPAYGCREQELSEVRLSMYNPLGYVAQQHIKNSEWTQEMVARYNLSPVALSRNLLDCVVSIRDHIRLEKNFGSLIQLPDNFAQLNDEDLDLLIVSMAMPWYINFYAGWRLAPNTLQLNYADVTGDPHSALEKTLRFSGITPDAAKIDKALDDVQQKRTRLNKGVSGRGADVAPQIKDKLRVLADLYPEFRKDRIFDGL